ncbi:MAG: NADH-quinone oxidoreductase subunit NuoG [Acidimicrobiales bacterium]
MPDPVTLTIDGVTVEAHKGELLIEVAERAGSYIPRFCYHPRMTSVGMCRMCIVDIDTGRGPALQPSCMIQVSDGMNVATESAATRKAQDGVLEFLLINHPLDCPVCDKGGECPLQDNAYAYGPGESRFVEEKRHFEKPIPISDVVFLDRERCILCDRCTRFAKEVAGDPLIHFINRGGQTEVNTFPDQPFASYFSGNTVQICPVGALTAKPFRFKARPWDLDKAETTCTSCGVGCRVTVEASRNRVLRSQGVDIDPVNWGWLCDKGRFDFEAIDAHSRLTEPLVRKPAGESAAGSELIAASWSEALGRAAEAIRETAASSVAVLGGSRLTNEAAYAWAKLAKGVIGTDNVDAQLGDGLPGEVVLTLPPATIDAVCAKGATILVIAGDVKEELPVLFLRLRHAVVHDGAKLIEIAAMPTGLTALAAASLRNRPGEAHEVVRALVAGGDAAAVLDGDLDAAKEIIGAGPITAIIGRASVAESSGPTVEAAAILLESKPDTLFLPVLRRANARGAVEMGLAPGLLPGRTTLEAGRAWFERAGWPHVPPRAGLDAEGILSAAANGKIDVLILLGADPAVDFPDHDLAARGLAGARTVIAVDTFLTESSRHADVVLAAAGWGETPGTTTNIEGRISTLGQRVTPPGTARHDWMIAAELALRLGGDLGIESLDEALDEIGAVAPAHAGISVRLIEALGNQDGVVIPASAEVLAAADGTRVAIVGVAHAATDDQGMSSTGVTTASEPAAEAGVATDEAAAAPTAPSPVGGEGRPAVMAWSRPPVFETAARDAYSLRLFSPRKLYDGGTLVQKSPSLAELAPGARLGVSPSDLARLAVGDGARVRVTSSRATLTVEAHADAAIPKGTAVVHFNQPGSLEAGALIESAAVVTEIRVETL